MITSGRLDAQKNARQVFDVGAACFVCLACVQAGRDVEGFQQGHRRIGIPERSIQGLCLLSENSLRGLCPLRQFAHQNPLLELAMAGLPQRGQVASDDVKVAMEVIQ